MICQQFRNQIEITDAALDENMSRIALQQTQFLKIPGLSQINQC